jgi:protein subunit release factor A
VVDLSPEDVRVDVIRIAGDGPCAVRVTHVPTGTAVTVDDQLTIKDNRARAIALLREALASGP